MILNRSGVVLVKPASDRLLFITPSSFRRFIAFWAALCFLLTFRPSLAFSAEPSPAQKIADLKFNANPSLGPKLQKTDRDIQEASAVLEKQFHDSGVVYEDAALTEYINSILSNKDLGVGPGDFQFKVKILKLPDENAFACPSGTIYLNAGLLPLIDNPDELRFVLAHEAMHVLGKHAVFQQQNYKNHTTFIKLLDIVIVPAASVANIYTDFQYSNFISGITQLTGTTAGLFYVASVQGYGRGEEIEADHFGSKVLYQMRNDTKAAVTFFQKFKDNQERYLGKSVTHFASSHEAPQDRVKRAEGFMPEGGRGVKPVKDRDFIQKTMLARLDGAEMNIKLGRIQHALDALEAIESLDLAEARTFYLLGEAYRRAGEDPTLIKDELTRKEWNKLIKPGEAKLKAEWIEKAQAYYQRSFAADPGQAEANRGLAALCEQRGEWANAAQYYQTYLDLRPGCADQRYVKAKIKYMNAKLSEPVNTDGKSKKGDKR